MRAIELAKIRRIECPGCRLMLRVTIVDLSFGDPDPELFWECQCGYTWPDSTIPLDIEDIVVVDAPD
jgi:hypothetical protein